jgi:hypothetical protein
MISGPALGVSLSVFLLCGTLAAAPWRYMPDVGNGYEALDSEKTLSVENGADPKHVAFSCAVRAARTHFFRASATGLLASKNDETRAEGSR